MSNLSTGVGRVMSDYAPRLLQRLKTERIPGIAVGVVGPHGLVWFGGYGAADLDTGLAPRAQTLFRVASITKTFTAALVLRLRDEGKLSLDAPLTTYIPEFARVRARVGDVAQVTLRRLLAHHSGLVTESPLPGWDTQEFPALNQILAAFPDTEVVLAPDTAFKYSNLAYGLLGEVIRRVSGTPYHKLLRERILTPLGMIGSDIELSDDMKSRLAVGYHARLFDDGYLVAPVKPLHGIAACGQLYSSVEDLARWVAFQLSSRSDSHSHLADPPLSRETLRESQRPIYLEPDWSVGYCMGWRANRFGDRVCHGHGGALFGYASHALFCLEAQIGVVCLANLWPHPGLLPLSLEIAESVISSGEWNVKESHVAQATVTPPVYRRLLGVYEARPGIFASIAFRDGQLRLEKSPLSDYLLHAPAVLEPAPAAPPSSNSEPSGDNLAQSASVPRFIVRGGRAAGESVVFVLNEQGHAASFTLGGFVYRRWQSTSTHSSSPEASVS